LNTLAIPEADKVFQEPSWEALLKNRSPYWAMRNGAAIRRSFAPVVSGCGSALNVQAIFAYNDPAWFPPPTIAEEIR